MFELKLKIPSDVFWGFVECFTSINQEAVNIYQHKIKCYLSADAQKLIMNKKMGNIHIT